MLGAVRYGLPAAILVAGLVLVIAGSGFAEAAGITLMGVALLVLLMNLYVRLSVASERDRDREEDARRYFERHGRWPSGST